MGKIQPLRHVTSFCTAVVIEVLGSITTIDNDIVKRIIPYVVSGLQPGSKKKLEQKVSLIQFSYAFTQLLLVNRWTTFLLLLRERMLFWFILFLSFFVSLHSYMWLFIPTCSWNQLCFMFHHKPTYLLLVSIFPALPPTFYFYFLQAGALMIVGLLAQRVALSSSLVKSLVRAIAEVAREDAKMSIDLQWFRMSVIALINLVQVGFSIHVFEYLNPVLFHFNILKYTRVILCTTTFLLEFACAAPR